MEDTAGQKTDSGRTHEKQVVTIAGLPRSGSTLLCNILNQNPAFHATETSGVLQLLLMVKNNWNNIIEFKAVRNEPAKLRVLRSMLFSFYADQDKKIIFDKCRGWPEQLAMLESILGQKAKMLVTVRDMRDVLASFEVLWRKESKTGQTSQEKAFPVEFQTVEGRCEVMMRANQPVGSAYQKMKDAILRGYADRMHFIQFERLTTHPEKVMRDVYTFLNEPYFPHDFEHVEQTTKEDDFFHGFTDLHTIRKSIEPVPSQWQTILGPTGEQYEKFNFWNKSTKTEPSK